MQSVMTERAQTATDRGAVESTPLLDLRHLDHQTLGDPVLRSDVLQLFLAETPKYVADLHSATDCKSWRMAVHTLKGVSLNLGAFRLAQLCKQFEGTDAAGSLSQKRDAAKVIAILIEATCQAVARVIPESAMPRA